MHEQIELCDVTDWIFSSGAAYQPAIAYYNLGLFVACMNLETYIIPMPYTIISLIPHKSSRK